MIQILAFLGSGHNRQLAEIEIEWLAEGPIGYSEYTAKIVVDTGENIRIISKNFLHRRDTSNVLGLMEALLSELDIDQTLLDCPPEKASKKRTDWFKDSWIRELGG